MSKYTQNHLGGEGGQINRTLSFGFLFTLPNQSLSKPESRKNGGCPSLDAAWINCIDIEILVKVKNEIRGEIAARDVKRYICWGTKQLLRYCHCCRQPPEWWRQSSYIFRWTNNKATMSPHTWKQKRSREIFACGFEIPFTVYRHSLCTLKWILIANWMCLLHLNYGWNYQNIFESLYGPFGSQLSTIGWRVIDSVYHTFIYEEFVSAPFFVGGIVLLGISTVIALLVKVREEIMCQLYQYCLPEKDEDNQQEMTLYKSWLIISGQTIWFIAPSNKLRVHYVRSFFGASGVGSLKTKPALRVPLTESVLFLSFIINQSYLLNWRHIRMRMSLQV